MKTQKSLNAIAFSLLFIAAVGCQKTGNHYKGDKYRGNPQANDEEKTYSSNPDESPGRVGPTVEGEEESQELPVFDPGMVVYRPYFVGVMDSASMMLLKNTAPFGEEIAPSDVGTLASLLPMLAGLMSKPASLVIQQTLGNHQENLSTFSQDLTSPTDEGLLAKILGGPKETRYQAFNRRVGIGGCPNAFVCVESQTYAPKDSLQKTFCYYDKASEKLTTIPYSPSPKAKIADFDQTYKTYPDYIAAVYLGDGNTCAPTLEEARSDARMVGIQAFRVSVRKISAAALANVERLVQADASIAIQYGVQVTLEKLNQGDAGLQGGNLQPYLDESLILQNETSYYMNETEQTTVKFVKSIRKPFNQKVSSVLRLIPGLTDLLSHDGLKIDYHFEFCQDQTFPEKLGRNYCEE
jgi:hypothetical protein